MPTALIDPRPIGTPATVWPTSNTDSSSSRWHNLRLGASMAPAHENQTKSPTLDRSRPSRMSPRSPRRVPDSPSSLYSSVSQRSSDTRTSLSIWERRGRQDNFSISPVASPWGPSPPDRASATLSVDEEWRGIRSAPSTATSFQASPSSFFQLSVEEMNPWPFDSVRPRSQSQRRATGLESEDIGLFAQAVAGFEGEQDLEDGSTTPRANGPRGYGASRSQSDYSSNRASRAERLVFPGNDRTYLNPPFQQPRNERSMPLPLPSPENEALPPTYSPNTFSTHLSTRYAQGSLMDHSLFVQATTGLVPDTETTDDDDLPDYAQSQLEMAQRRRREGLIRAAELERRWAEASGRRR